MLVNQCVPSSSKLPRLDRSTKRHFPVKSTTKGTQLGVESHTYNAFHNIHTICTICVDTTWHHNITLWLKLLLRTHKNQHSMILQTGVSWPNIQSIQIKHKRKLSCLSIDIYKWKRLRSLTIYQILPRAQDRSWGKKLNVEVHMELLVRLKSLCKNIK